MAEVQQKESGGKKGAQKKMTIRVDFTPMVDMNMLLITFFMLCTTMIKSQTLQITLPTNDSNVKKEQMNQAKESEAITLILDTEYNENNAFRPKTDPETGKTIHNIYWYQGIADTTFTKPDFIQKERFVGDKREGGVKVQQGIRKILRGQNEAVMAKYDELKTKWKNREITKEAFDSLAKKNAADSTLSRPVVIIKPGPNTTYEGLINALDEMNINQISRYSIQLPTHTDTLLLQALERKTGETIIRPTVRKASNK